SALGQRTEVSNIDPTAAFPFGHGLSYTDFSWSQLVTDAAEVATSGAVSASLRVRNAGDRAGVDVVQLYLHDPVAQVPRPVRQLVGYRRVALAAGEEATVRFEVPADLFSYTGRDLRRIVEPGEIVLSAGRSSGDVASSVSVRVTGPVRTVDHTRALGPSVTVARGR